MALKKIDFKLIAMAIALIFFIILPFINGTMYWQRLIMSLFLFIPVVIGCTIMARMGALHAAQGAFMSIGAYTVAILTKNYGMNFWLVLLISIVVTGIIAMCVGFPALRVTGPYFVFMTWGLNQLVMSIWIKAETISNGVRGIDNIPRPSNIGGISFNSPTAIYYLGLVLMVVCTIILFILYKSHFGLAMSSIGQNHILSESLGINVMAVKVKAFVTVSIVASVMGGYFAIMQTYITPSDFGVWNSFNYVIFSIVGGIGSFVGAIYSSVVLTFFPIAMQYIPGWNPFYKPIVYGIFVLFVVMVYPRGIVGLVENAGKGIERIFTRNKKLVTDDIKSK
ncbi:MAG: branched-chain amino acid ABC transporter permease [Actinomycetota bacterium]